MKKILFSIFAVAASVAAVAQTDVWVWKSGVLVTATIADSITFTEPVFTDFYHDGTEGRYNYVDLGLTSGTKWATMNLGANKSEDYGNYYAWGETDIKSTYSWSTYLDGNITGSDDCGTDKDLLKGVTDIAGTEYDVVYVNWGGKWRMPTKAQQDELRGGCYWVWTEDYNNSGVKGYIVYKAKDSSDKGVYVYSGGTPSASYSLSDAHIFLPAAGRRYSVNLIGAGSDGYYWSSAPDTDYPSYAWDVYFYSGYAFHSNGYRNYGQSVRAVIPAE